MNKEDYSKYYIQGSDHYLIPKDVFNELFDEMSNWREEAKELNQKYLNAVADYETTMFEKEQLNSLVNSCQEKIRQLKKQLEEERNKVREYSYKLSNFRCEETYEKQQKEFIEYLENMLDNKNDIFSVVRVKDVLSKFKKIIGSDINVGSIGGK